MSVGFGLPTKSLQRCMRLHINCIESGQPWASIAFVLDIAEKYEMEITFSIRAFPPPKALQRGPRPYPSEQNCISAELQVPLLLLQSVPGTCCHTVIVGNTLLNSKFLYSLFSPKSLPFSHSFFLFLGSITLGITKSTMKKWHFCGC